MKNELREDVCISILRGTEFTKVEEFWENEKGSMNIILDGTNPVSGRRVCIIRGHLPPTDISGALVIGSHQVGKMVGFDNLSITLDKGK